MQNTPIQPVSGVAQATGGPLTPMGGGVPIQSNPIPLSSSGDGAIANTGGAQPSVSPDSSSPIAQIIQQGRAQGVPDNQIFDYLHQNGMVPTNAVVQQGQQQGMTGIGGLALGAERGALNTINNLSALGQTALSQTAGRVANLLTGKGFTPTSVADLNDTVDLEAHGTTEKVGKLGEQIGEFFIPGGAIEDVANIANKGIEGLELSSKLANTALKVGAKATAEGASAAVVTGVQTKDIKQAVTNGFISAGLSGGLDALSNSLSSLGGGMKKLSSNLELSSLRLTPAQKVAYAPKLADLGEYLGKTIPLGSPEARFEAAKASVQNMEDTIQKFLTSPEVQGVTAPKQDLIDVAQQLKLKYAADRDFNEISSQIDGFTNLIKNHWPDNIPLQPLNTLKRSTFEKAFNAAGTKVSDAVEFDLGDILKKGLENATDGLTVGGKSLGEFNKNYGVAITAKKLLKTAMGRPQVDFVNRLTADAIGGFLGSATGGPVGAAIGTAAGNAVANYLPATGLKGIASKTLLAGSKVIPKVKLPAGTSGAVGKAIRIR